MPKINREGVASSAIRSVGHDKASRTMDVEFRKSGAVYRYKDVSTRTANGLKGSSSVGRYFNRNVRGEYDFTRTRATRARTKAKRTR